MVKKGSDDKLYCINCNYILCGNDAIKMDKIWIGPIIINRKRNIKEFMIMWDSATGMILGIKVDNNVVKKEQENQVEINEDVKVEVEKLIKEEKKTDTGNMIVMIIQEHGR